MVRQKRLLQLAVGSAFALLTLAAQPSLAQATAQPTHVTLERPQATNVQEGEIEVLEFFAYSCVHCANAEPQLAAWESTLPDNVKLKRVPVAFNRGMGDLQRAYFTFEALNRLDLHQKLFDAIHKDKLRVFDEAAITEWAVKQGVDKSEFSHTFNSFGVNTRVNQANAATNNYQIQSTPSMAVNGRYVTSPSYTNTIPGMLREVDALVQVEVAKTAN